MLVGELVVRAYEWHCFEIGIVIDVNHWVDKGAPDRNFGTDIMVLWSDGTQTPEAEYELDLLSDWQKKAVDIS